MEPSEKGEEEASTDSLADFLSEEESYYTEEDEGEVERAWINRSILLRPGRSWPKPAGSIVYLKFGSISIKNGSIRDARGILVADMPNGSFSTICTLLPTRPSSLLRLVWGKDQNVILSNIGSRAITIYMEMRI